MVQVGILSVELVELLRSEVESLSTVSVLQYLCFLFVIYWMLLYFRSYLQCRNGFEIGHSWISYCWRYDRWWLLVGVFAKVCLIRCICGLFELIMNLLIRL